MSETAYFRGEGGGIWPMDLPLPEEMLDKVTKGYLRRVNADGSPYVEDVQEQAPTGPPPHSAVKAEWVGYAVRVHDVAPDDAEAMTKQDLIDRYGRE